MDYFIGILYILHGLVHLLYMGHSLQYFELEKGLRWPDDSKLLYKITSQQQKRYTASVLCILAAVFFVTSGISVLIGHSWNHIEVYAAVGISTLPFAAFWNGSRFSSLPAQGGIAIIINILILIYTII